MGFSGQQRKQLRDSLIDAFPTTASLERMLSDELDKNLRAIAGEGSLQDIVYRLIETANSQGWVKDLVLAACRDNPGNLKLKGIAKELLLTTSPDIPLEQSNQLLKILILAAIPNGLHLDKDIREIESTIRATNRDLFEIRIRTAVRSQDIRRAIAEEQPQIVHFCGQALKDGSLLLEEDGEKDKHIAPQALASLFELHADYVKCVLLNACYSEKPTVAISQYINYVIGMNNAIQDKAAIAFTQGFYDGLGYQKLGNQDLFQRAFDEAIVAIKLENILQCEIPIIKKKVNINVYADDDYYNLGNTRRDLGDKKGAIEDFQNAATIHRKLGKIESYNSAQGKTKQFQQKKCNPITHWLSYDRHIIRERVTNWLRENNLNETVLTDLVLTCDSVAGSLNKTLCRVYAETEKTGKVRIYEETISLEELQNVDPDLVKKVMKKRS